MSNLLRSQIASLITRSAQAGLKELDKNTPLAHTLKGKNIDTLLKNSVQQLCDEMSYSEMARIISLVASLKSGLRDKERAKKEVKSIAGDIVKRIEKKSGGLLIPLDLRDLLFNL